MILTNTGKTLIRNIFMGDANGLAYNQIWAGAGHAYNSGTSSEYSDLDETATALEHSSTSTEITTTGLLVRTNADNPIIVNNFDTDYTFTFTSANLDASGSDDEKVIREFGLFDASTNGTMLAVENQNAIIKIAAADIIYEVKGVIQ